MSGDLDGLKVRAVALKVLADRVSVESARVKSALMSAFRPQYDETDIAGRNQH